MNNRRKKGLKLSPLSPEQAATKLRDTLTLARTVMQVPGTREQARRLGAGVRPVVRRSHSGWVGYHHGRRFPSMEYEHGLERDFLVRAEPEHDFHMIVRQPATILWTDGNGIARHHIPDFGAIYRSVPTWLEIKPEVYASQPGVIERTEWMRRAFAPLGIEYAMITERWIRIEPELGNAQKLALAKNCYVSPEDVSNVIALLSEHPGGLTASEIVAILKRKEEFIYVIFAMMIDGVLSLARTCDVLPINARFVPSNDKVTSYANQF